MMNNQEVFDKVATHLFTQGKRATDSLGACVYRGPNGTSCAVGCLIPDELYHPGIEGGSIVTIRHRPVAQPIVAALNFEDPDRYKLLEQLQHVHDDQTHNDDRAWKSTATMRAALKAVSDQNGLDHSILKTLSFKDR